MPQPRVIEVGPRPRTEETGFEKFSQGLFNRLEERRVEERDQDILNNIFRKNQEQQISDAEALHQIINTPGISPSKRVLNAEAYANRLKASDAVHRELIKAQSKMQNARVKELKEQEEARLMQEFLANPDVENMTPTQLNKAAIDFGFKPKTAGEMANRHRMANKESRMSRQSIVQLYQPEIKQKLDEIKLAVDDEEKSVLRKELSDLKKQKNEDLRDFKDNANYVPRLLRNEEEAAAAETPVIAPVVAPVEAAPTTPAAPAALEPRPSEDQAWLMSQEDRQAVDQALQEAIRDLTLAAPPENFKGRIKWLPAEESPDGVKHSFKSDGRKWVQIS